MRVLSVDDEGRVTIRFDSERDLAFWLTVVLEVEASDAPKAL